PKTAIVTDSITSEGLAKFINELQGRHHRFKRGYKNVINEAIRAFLFIGLPFLPTIAALSTSVSKIIPRSLLLSNTALHMLS
ncbi:hypothetical protein ACTPEM_26860, partial [Clostridioides difficile]